jgi:FMN-binding domain
MRRALAALLVTAVAVVLLARYETEAPTDPNPHSALRAQRTPQAIAQPSPTPALKSTVPGRPGAPVRTATGPALTTPFSVIQVKATLTGRRLTGVETVALAGDGAFTNALNARAEPILREEALKAGSADIDVVSGATSTSMIWIESLQAAIEKARRG